MKVQSYNVYDVGNKSALSLVTTDRLKRPVRIKITVEPVEIITAFEEPSAVMDHAELSELMGIFAEIAWTQFKWRPRALAATVAHLVNSFKIPKAQ